MIHKKLISLILILCFVLSGYSTVTHGEEINTDYQNIATKLSMLGVVESDDVDLNANLTRKEIVPILVKYLKMEEAIDKSVSQSMFLDISSQDENLGSYALLYDLGYIKGSGDRRFYPDRYITVQEAATFLLRVMGYAPIVELSGGFLEVAATLNMLEGVDRDGDQHVTLGDIYLMIDKGLQAGSVITTDNRIEISETENVLSKLFGIKTAEGIVTGNKYTNLYTSNEFPVNGYLEIEGVVYDVESSEYDALLGKNVEVYYKEYSGGTPEIMYVCEVDNTVQIVENEPVYQNGRINYYDDNGKEKYIRIDDVAPAVIYNGKSYSGYGNLSNIIPVDGFIECIDNDKDEVYEVFKITEYENYIVDYVNADKNIVYDKFQGKTLDLNTDENIVAIYDGETGRKVNFSDIKAWDVLTVASSRNITGKKIKNVYISRNTVVGKVTAKKQQGGKNVYTINGTEYYPSVYFNALEPNLAVGSNELTFCIDYNGKLAAVNRTATSDSDYKYGVVANIKPIEDDNGQAQALIRVYDQSGEWVKGQISEKIIIDGKSYKLDNGSAQTAVNTYVTPGEVVRYKVSQGKFSDIDTDSLNYGNSTNLADMGNLHVISSGEKFTQRYDVCTKVDENKVPQGEFWHSKPGSIYVFKIPELTNLENYDGYQVETSITGYYYGIYVDNLDGFVAYNTAVSEIPQATCLLIHGASVSRTISDDSSYYLVSDMSYGLNSDDEAALILTLSTNGTKKDYFAMDEVFYQNSDTPNVKTTFSNLQLKKGDVIRFGTNTKGYIDNIKVMYRADASGNLPAVYTNPSYDVSFDTKYGGVVGRLVKVDSTNSMVRFVGSVENGVEKEYMTSLAWMSGISMYDRETDEVRKISMSEMLPGDVLVMNMEYSDRALGLVVIR